MEQIKAWLNSSKPYAQGLQLYAEFGRDASILRRLHQGENPTNKVLLFNSLKQLLNPVLAKPKPVLTPIIQSPVSVPEISKDKSNPIAEAAKREADLLYKEMMDVRAVLFSLCPLEEEPLENSENAVESRNKLAIRLHELQYDVDNAYDKYRYALEHESLPPTIAHEVIDPVRLFQEITNIRKNLSWYKRKKDQTAEVLSAIKEREERLEKLLKQYENATGHKGTT